MDVVCSDCKTILNKDTIEEFAEDKNFGEIAIRPIIVCTECDAHVEVSDTDYLMFRMRKLADDNDYLRTKLDKTYQSMTTLENENEALRRQLRNAHGVII
jgi:hypothetical protein